MLAVLDENVSVCPFKMRMNRQIMCNAYTFLSHTSLKIITRKKNQNMVLYQRRRNNNRSEFKWTWHVIIGADISKGDTWAWNHGQNVPIRIWMQVILISWHPVGQPLPTVRVLQWAGNSFRVCPGLRPWVELDLAPVSPTTPQGDKKRQHPATLTEKAEKKNEWILELETMVKMYL